MNKGKYKLLLSALLLSTFSMPVHAITSSALDGTLLFNKKQNWGHRIYHAFDLPYTSQTSIIGSTFSSETITAPISNNLVAIASRGYTHIQISPPHLTTPSISSTVTQDGKTPTVISHNQKTNGWEFSYQPLLCVLDEVYQAELDSVFGEGIKTASQYGVTINGKVVGYRLGSDRYGSLKDLKDLIDAANGKGLKIIADAVFNQTSGYMTNKPVGSSPQFHPYTYVPTSGSEKATYTWDTTVDLTSFFHPYSMDPWYAPSSWVYGPDLNVENPVVQQMIVGYMQLLSDIGICGIRFDLLYGLGPIATKKVLEQANATGMFQDAPFGYGENDQSFQDLESYGAIVPVQDHPLHYSLANCLVVGLPVSTLVAPKALGNITTATFSVNHDQYPGVSTGTGSLTGFYSKSQSPEDVIDRTTSQLAIAYLCAKRDGNPHILRFEDERDSKTLIQRSLAFRVLMEQQNAPHEYIAALPYTHDVLLIARQYGFVIINRNPTYDYKITKDVIKNSGIPSAYLPDGEYNELLSLGTGGAYTSSPQSYTLSSSSFSTDLAVGPMDAKFLVLKNTTGQNAYDVTFKASCSTTVTGDLVFIVGNHPLLGNWGARPDSLNGLLCQKSYPTLADSGVTWPNWTSLPLRFPVGMSLQYKFAVANTQANNGSIKKWESGANRTYAVTGDVTVSASPPANWPN